MTRAPSPTVAEPAERACARGLHCGAHACTVPVRCLRGKACLAAVELDVKVAPGKKKPKVGAPADRPLCDTCERAVAQVLADVPQLFFDLEQAMPHRTSGGGRGTRRPGPLGSPMLTNGRALNLQETVHQLLVVWEDVVRDTAGLSMVSRQPFDARGQRTGRGRAGGETQRAADLLAAHLTAWLVHPPVEYALTQSNADPDDPRAAQRLDTPIYVTEAGWEAAGRLLDWRSRVRSALGLTRSVVHRDEPCMYCEVRAIVETAGEDHIRCEACARSWPREEYLTKVRGFEPYLRKLAKATTKKESA